MGDSLRRKCFKCGLSPGDDTNLKLYRFPRPGSTNIRRCEAWARFCLPDRPWSSVDFQHKLYSEHRMLCDKHFKRTEFIDLADKKLCKHAVPDTDVNEDSTPVAVTGAASAKICNYPKDLAESNCLSVAVTGAATSDKRCDVGSDPEYLTESKSLSLEPNTGSEILRSRESSASPSIAREELCSWSDLEDAPQECLVEEVIKQDIPKEVEQQCRLCLSVDRNLQELAEYAPLYVKLLFDNCQNTTVPSFMYEMLACWECRAELRRIQKFQDKVRRANAAFETSQNQNSGNVSRPSSRTDPRQDHTVEELLASDEECVESVKEEAVELLEDDVEETTPPDPLAVGLDFLKDQTESLSMDTGVGHTNRQVTGTPRQNDHTRAKRAGESQDLHIQKRPKILKIILDKTQLVSKISQGDTLLTSQPCDVTVRVAPIDCDEIFTKVKMGYAELQCILSERRNKDSFKSLKYKCDSCLLGFTSQSYLQDHFTNCHDESLGEFECDICYRRFESVSAASMHRSSHFVRFVCKLCQFQCLTKNGRVSHFRRHQAPKSMLRQNVFARASPDAHRT